MILCKKCGKEKEESLFYKKKSGKIRSNACIECYKSINKEINKNNNRKNFEKRKMLAEKYSVGQSQIQYYGLENVLIVHMRDKWRCKGCGTDQRLTIHHKDHQGRKNKGKMNNTPENLILLCAACHASLHGKENIGRKYIYKREKIRIKKTCLICKNDFEVIKSREKTAKFCSFKCASIETKKCLLSYKRTRKERNVNFTIE